ncbi:O-antigen ligase family protein [Candidatus Falkowbacteria bacterium]|nr:O-antigen ligase family protein [Candidatus Falkowbacteria bacterium]
MSENRMNLSNQTETLGRLLLIIAPLFLLLVLFNLTSFYIILSLIVLALVYVFLKRQLWIFLVLAVPSLVFGKFINFYVNPGWVYEMSLAEVFILAAAIVFLLDKFLNKNIEKIKIDKLSFFLAAYALLAVASFWQIIDFRLYIFGLKVLIFSFLSYFLALNLFGNEADTIPSVIPGFRLAEDGESRQVTRPPAGKVGNPESLPVVNVDAILDPGSTAGMTEKKMKWFLYGLAATAVILSVQIFVKFYQMGWSSKFFFDRSNILIPMGPVALVSAILVLLLPIILTFYFDVSVKEKSPLAPSAGSGQAPFIKGGGKPFLLLSFIFGSLAVFLTLGKAAILSLFAGLFYLFIKLKDRRIIFILTVAFFIILSYIFFSSFFTGLAERLAHIFVDANTKARIMEYEVGWKIIKDNLWLGVGSGQQLVYFRKLLNYSQCVNNYFLQAAIDLGILGFALVCLIAVSIFGSVRKYLKVPKGRNVLLAYGFTASLIAASLNGLAEVTFFALQYAVIFWIMLGAFANLKTYEK